MYGQILAARWFGDQIRIAVTEPELKDWTEKTEEEILDEIEHGLEDARNAVSLKSGVKDSAVALGALAMMLAHKAEMARIAAEGGTIPEQGTLSAPKPEAAESDEDPFGDSDGAEPAPKAKRKAKRKTTRRKKRG